MTFALIFFCKKATICPAASGMGLDSQDEDRSLICENPGIFQKRISPAMVFVGKVTGSAWGERRLSYVQDYG